MDKPQNKKQKQWIKLFLSHHKNATIVNVRNCTCGYYAFVFEWCEYVDLPKYSCYDSGYAYYLHRTYLELTPSAATRNVLDQISETFYPRCSQIIQNIHATGQISLGEPIYPMPPSVQKPKVRFSQRYRRRYRRRIPGQLELPVLGLPAKLHEIRTAHGEPIKSSQALLAEKVQWQSLDTGESLYVPQAFIDMLEIMNATSQEKIVAERMLLVVGEIAALNYIENIAEWRKQNYEPTKFN